MKTTSHAFLKKLGNMRPKPTKTQLRDLFVDIKNTDIDELLDLFSAAKAQPEASPQLLKLEKEIKGRLRSVNGKAKDFKPYLAEALADHKVKVTGLTTKSSLARDCSAVLEAAPGKAEDILLAALDRYITENDNSYQLKSA